MIPHFASIRPLCTRRDHGRAWWLLSLSLWLSVTPAHSALDFLPPPRGSLVTRFQEDLAPEYPGQVMVIRLYEDAAENQIREFEINGAVFQVQVLPSSEPGYYLVDTTGSGRFDTRVEGEEARLVLPAWVLFRK
ncbi:MAG: DUF2782 domain-containing protein [Magnetococcus sp. DMHC-1]|nr:DUF2782 domain-containing protein [Magnetococcales bacterium]